MLAFRTRSGGRVTRYRVLYWQEIPSLVRVVRDDGSHVSHQLPDWFQQEIDRVAMEQGLAGSDDYLAQWRWADELEHPGSVEEVVAELVAAFGQRAGS
jgi:cvfA/B/C family virulence factor